MRGSTNTFPRVTGASPLAFLTQGYAVLMDATMPVVGDPETMNDTYVEQIAQAAEAAIDVLDAKGVVDRRRVVVGGHSYGAFMTANLLAHTDLFAAGIARSGAYNRTLTPFGFQSERRSFWEAPELYLRVSPFTYAHKINEPILLDPRRGRQQQRHVPHPVGAALPGAARQRRHRALRRAAARVARLPRARVGAPHAGRDDRVGGPLGEEPPRGCARRLCPEGAQKVTVAPKRGRRGSIVSRSRRTRPVAGFTLSISL